MKTNRTRRSSKTKRFFGLSAALCLVILAAAAVDVPAKNNKYGIFVGITDYPGINSDLPGAVPDAKNLRGVLMSKYRFPAANTVLLLDQDATRDNIIAKIKAYGQLAGDGDVLVFHYSGHGSLFWDVYSEELDETEKIEVNLGPDYRLPLDYYDSTIVPWDAALKTSGKPWGNQILDDELYNLFSEITKKGTAVIFISDSCHSGSISKAEAVDARIKFMPPEQTLGVQKLVDLKLSRPKNQTKIESRGMSGSYLALTAARDNQAAADLTDRSNRSFGLFTEVLVSVLTSAKTPMSYRRLMELVSSKVLSLTASRPDLAVDQNPQLDTRFGNGDAPLFEPVVRLR